MHIVFCDSNTRKSYVDPFEFLNLVYLSFYHYIYFQRLTYLTVLLAVNFLCSNFKHLDMVSVSCLMMAADSS